MSNLVIAIDGPAASGKSTVSKKIAAELNHVYVDSGSVYRGVTWCAMEHGVDVHDAEAVIEMLSQYDWEFYVNDQRMGFKIDGVYPGLAIRSDEVASNVSYIARIPEVRTFVVEKLREMKSFGSLVVEGRDIGSVVFPDSKNKFYLDADPEERARRRSSQNEGIGEENDVGKVQDALKKRDDLDSQRKVAPLQVALGAEVVNTTGMSIDEVVQFIINQIQ